MRNLITWFHELKKRSIYLSIYLSMYISITICFHVSKYANINLCSSLSVFLSVYMYGLPQRDISHEMMDHPTINVIHKTTKEINAGKAPGLNGIPVEVLHWGGDKITAKSHRLISDVLFGAPVP